MSVHFWKSHNLAASKGAAFGALPPADAKTLGELSKRELIEIALHLSAVNQGVEASNQAALDGVMIEYRILKQNGLI